MEGQKIRFRLKVLTDEQVQDIHEATLKILEKTGVRFDSENAKDRVIRAGAAAHPTRKNVVTFPRGMVEDSIKKIAPYGTYYARNPKNDICFDGEHQFAHSLGGNPSIVDLETGEHRMSTLKDVENTCRIMDALPSCNSISNLVVATDVPPELLVVKTAEAMMRNSSKCISSYALSVETVDILVKMWACVAGGIEELRKRPLLDVYGSPSSPLTYDAHAADVIVRGAEHGVPVDLVPCPISGGTAPITLAGGLAQQNAELLAGVMLVQTVTTKVPIQYSGRLSMMDLRSGKNVWGMPEMALASAATVQIAHKYRMIADVYGVTMDGNMIDVQAGIERAIAAIIPALAGADNLSGIGGGWENAASYEMLVIDNEIYSDVFRAIRGFEVDDDTLALDLIDKAGPMGNFLVFPHTMKYLRAGELRYSTLYDKRTAEKTRKEGVRPLEAAAKDVVKKILKEHVPEPLDKDVDKELSQVVKEAEKQLLRKA
ncbi:MAG: trimethylamine methyltransferase family protein [Candidatus Thermoplasmatota archaeon]|nr:trimethylamine methyltransferase family protein [Candidatus Thermoplasmatota archaeon]